MAETNVPIPVVASDDRPFPESVKGSSPPAAEIVVSRSPSPQAPPEPLETTAEPTTTEQRESPTDPRVVALRAMFPDYDDAILQSVLESVEWNQDRAVDTLLIMSDPDYKPEPVLPQRPQRRHTAPVMSQEQLDEQFARQLLIQEEEQMTQRAVNRFQGPPGHPGTYPVQPGGQPVYPGGQYPQQQTGQGQGVGEFQEQITKFAETGKKTIGSFLTKVKTKFQEFEQGRASGPSTTQYPAQQYPNQQWSPGPASYYGPPQPNQPHQGFQYAGQSSPTSVPLPTSHSVSPPLINLDPTSETTSIPKTQTNTVPPPLASPAAPIDGGKLGLLPKRPVSLIRDDNPTVAGNNSDADAPGPTMPPKTKGYTVDDDDDGLEYAESPFDDTTHKK